MNFDDELREALKGYEPTRRTDFDLSHVPPQPRKSRVAVAVVALAIAAMIGIVLITRNPTANPTDVSTVLGLDGPQIAKSIGSVDPHEASARAEAKKLLEAFVPPQGATRTNDPAPLNAPPTEPSSPNTIDLNRSWHLSGTADDLAALLEAKPPTGMHVIGAGRSAVNASGGPNQPSRHMVILAPTDASLASGVNGSLQLSMADFGDGVVVLRADAVTTWTQLRMTIAHSPGLNDRGSVRRVTITDPQVITRIAHLLDGLEPAADGTVVCPKDDGEQFALTFWPAGKSNSVAKAVVKAMGCRSVTFTIHGNKPYSYRGNDELVDLLKGLAP